MLGYKSFIIQGIESHLFALLGVDHMSFVLQSHKVTFHAGRVEEHVTIVFMLDIPFQKGALNTLGRGLASPVLGIHE